MSVVGGALHIQSHPPKGKQRAYSVANVFSGSVTIQYTTKVRWEIMHMFRT